MVKKKVVAAPHPQSLDIVFPGDLMGELKDTVQLESLGDDPVDYDALDGNLEGTFALIGQMDLPEERLKRAPDLKAIFNVEGNFYQNIDYDYCFRNNIHVLNCGAAYSQAVAEMSLGMALDLSRGISREDRRFREGREVYLSDGCRDSVLLSGSEVGVIGFGNLGRAMLKLLAPFHCSIKVFDPWIPGNVILEAGCIPATLEDVLKTTRFIFVFAGVTRENQGFLNREKLEMIRKDSFFFLMSRAAVVDFDALCSLTSQGAFTAATDVFPQEPLAGDHPARRNDHLLLSAHRAGGIPQAFSLIGRMVLDDLGLILRGLPPLRMQKAQWETVKSFASKPAG
ncbi:NAD(P)-dependent oxidoreductase [Oceanispirochaeta sp.]|uniref:NAD(P)-dependent oxidoreductase n=1 Tax=Oceanispirochaeta sp. TaxID=2035350 RepID=UPI00260B245F|nr:NAD(P)-dependent oxidoreductase [Oceanispirochaeta sp.]MDA3958081.1 NAD(P)-dependent oxidoreductase [Oceanispirochaeta sp.]